MKRSLIMMGVVCGVLTATDACGAPSLRQLADKAEEMGLTLNSQNAAAVAAAPWPVDSRSVPPEQIVEKEVQTPPTTRGCRERSADPARGGSAD